MNGPSYLRLPGRNWKIASGTPEGGINRRFRTTLETPVMLSFPAWLTADFTEIWDTPVNLRYILDCAATHKEFCWLLRGDPHHLHPQLSAVLSFDQGCIDLPIELRPIKTPDIDSVSAYLLVTEINRRSGIDARCEERHEQWYEDLLSQLPKANVPYEGRA